METAAYGGTHSMLVSGRTQTWNGPAYNLLGKLQKGTPYELTAYVKLADDLSDVKLKLTVTSTVDGKATYQTVCDFRFLLLR
ncbi:carbohydrate binding domain-containing protein [Paenibacillus sp. CC-CFT747]|nr:carbohydrate binding domain-containing protein [Paenibacillus sp. CC-CFT747]